MPEPTPEAWAQIRHDYEHTDRQIVDICADHGITVADVALPREALGVAQKAVAHPAPGTAGGGG